MPGPVKLPQPPLDPQDLLARFQQAATQHGFSTEEISLGIPAFSRAGAGPPVHLSAGIHGDEPAGVLAALTFLEQGPTTEFPWLITPLLNPTGIALGTRENEHGQDLNRDYYQPRSREIAAQCEWLEQQATPALFFSLHEDYDAQGFYFYEIQTNTHPSIHEALFAQVTAHLPIEPGPLIDGRESTGPGWFFKGELPDLEEFMAEEGGIPEAVYLSQKGCPLSLTFETPTHAAPLETRIAAHLTAIEATLAAFRKF